MSRYDGRTTTFAPDGRLYQVEYAIEAIHQAAPAVGILAKDGIVLAVQKGMDSKLLAPSKHSEKIYPLDDHVISAVAGLTSDANILINYSRLSAQRYTYAFCEPQPVEQLVQQVCDMKQGYTQYGGLRPFGVSFLFAGWDKHYGFQLYQSIPSGIYGGWKATAIGTNESQAQSLLKSEYNEDCTVEEALKLALKTLAKTMESSSPSAERMEFVTVTREDGKVIQHTLSKSETETLIKSAELESASAGDA